MGMVLKKNRRSTSLKVYIRSMAGIWIAYAIFYVLHVHKGILGHGVTLFVFAVASTLILSALFWVKYRQQKEDASRLDQYAKDALGASEPIEPPEMKLDEYTEAAHIMSQFHEKALLHMQEVGRINEKAVQYEREQSHIKRMQANNLNHEIKTPLSIITGYIETMLQHDVDAETRKKFLQRCMHNIERLQNMTVNLSLLTNLDDGVNTYELVPINFSEVAEQVLEDMTVMLASKGLQVFLKLPKQTMIMGENSLIVNILENLVKNAYTYSEGTLVKLEVLEEDEESYSFCFSDNGLGVPEECVGHLFDRFYRVESYRQHNIGGTGLGLCIVKSAVEAQKGTIKAYNIEPHGLAFTFRLKKANAFL